MKRLEYKAANFSGNGAAGDAIAMAFARPGAMVLLTGRHWRSPMP